MHVFVDIWMWMDGWMNVCVYICIYFCMNEFKGKQVSGLRHYIRIKG